jgi:hypothetical protein
MTVDGIAASFAAAFERNGWVWGTGRVRGHLLEGNELRDAVVDVKVPTAKQIAATIREIVGIVRTTEGTASCEAGRIRVERVEGGMRVMLIAEEHVLSED